MKRLLAIAFLLSAATLGAAGYRHTRTVGVYSTYAQGSLGAARASSDSLQYIGCQIHANEAWDSRSMTCMAMNSSGAFTYCQTDNPHLVDAMAYADGNSWIAFTFSTNANCLALRVDTFSYDVAKQ